MGRVIGMAALLLLVSLAGLFPGATLPLTFGWKAVTAFDVLFGAVSVGALVNRAFRPLDRGLVVAGGAFAASAWLTLLVHPATDGPRMAFATSYSILVLLVAAHLKIDAAQARRLVLWATTAALLAAWATIVVELVSPLTFRRNHTESLPDSLPRLGGFTGAGVLVLFLVLAAPFAKGWISTLGILGSGVATFSRAMAGIAVATLLSGRRPWIVRASAALLLGAALFAYAIALTPNPTDPTILRPRLEPGPYPVLHIAALRMFGDSPVIGQGPGAFPEGLRRFTSGHERALVGGQIDAAWAPHSAIFGLAAEQGLVGLATFTALFGVILVRLRRGAAGFRSQAQAGLAGLLVGGLTVDWIALKGLWLFLGFLIAASRPFSSTEPGGEPDRPSGSPSASASW